MIFVPTQSLSKLVCAHCNNHLSYFPIYFHREKGSFCGRCPKPHGSDVIRNEIYESIAQTQKFPCRYSTEGCTENLIPEKIPHHEITCPYIKCQCPALANGACTWEGFTKDLIDHYEGKHPTFLLRDAQFEVDFINGHNENCLLPFEEDYFIVNRSCDPQANVFSCTVTYLGASAHVRNYTYKVILENEKRSRKHVIKKKLNAKAEINIEGVTNTLDNPTSVIATIQMIEPPPRSDITGEEAKGDGSINYELLKELECTVCLEYMLPPIHQCLTGHSLCLKCRNSVQNCPSCQQEFKDTQNFTLAKVINFITYPCKNKRCKFTAKARDIRKHEASCIFGLVKCPLRDYEDCQVEVILSEMYDHLLRSHPENVLELETVNLPFEEDRDYEDCYIIRYNLRLFKLHYKYQNGELSWAMQLIGSAEESLLYMFDIDVIDNSGNNQRAYFKKICSPQSDSFSAFVDGKSFIYIDYEQIKSMITTDLTYRVRILHG